MNKRKWIIWSILVVPIIAIPIMGSIINNHELICVGAVCSVAWGFGMLLAIFPDDLPMA